MNTRTLLLSCLIMAHATPALIADEGMWLFNHPPHKILKDRYNFDADPAWLEHVQKSSVRFNSGGSGSFVSADGLVMTNHHVGADSLHKLSTADKDLVQDGFYAKSYKDELKCVDLELNVLMSIEDVTDRVNKAVPADADPATAQKARRAIIATIEKESLDKTGLRSDVVTLYQGGWYHLYRYKKYTDVRMVFAPEKDIAFFGGDPDNFEYPRYDLDVCFVRVYENDKPAKIEHFFKWSAAGAKDNELIFVSGHPGKTDRLNTVAHLEFLRDRSFPTQLDLLRRWEVLLLSYSNRGIENARRAQDELFGFQNSRKARLGGLAGLQDPQIMDAKRKAEAELRKIVNDDPQLQKAAGPAWDEVSTALNTWEGIYNELQLLEQGNAFHCRLFHIARTLVRLAEEKTKPNAERLREYGEAGLESLEQDLFSTAPIYADLETLELGDSLSYLLEKVKAESTLVQKIMAGKSPSERAAELVGGTKLADVKVRRQLAEGGRSAIEASDDPMIALARLVDPPSRKVRKTFEEKVSEPLKQAYAKIAKARFAAFGQNTYPDATFTLRLAFGEVKGYQENGKTIPPWTTMGGTYKHAEAHANKEPFLLPASWRDGKQKLNLDTPFNFVSTADIIGGNSGSPVINRHAEIVGLIFDGNIQSLVLDFAYSDDQARAVSVHSSSIVEALRKIYGAGALADELTGGKK